MSQEADQISEKEDKLNRKEVTKKTEWNIQKHQRKIQKVLENQLKSPNKQKRRNVTVVASTSQKQKRKRVTRKIGKTKAASVGPDLRKGPALVEELVVQIKLRVNINCQGTSTNL